MFYFELKLYAFVMTKEILNWEICLSNTIRAKEIQLFYKRPIRVRGSNSDSLLFIYRGKMHNLRCYFL